MSVYRRKDSKVWYIALMKNGRRVQFSSKTADLNEAKQIELAFKKRLAGGSRERFVSIMDALVGDEDEFRRGSRALVRRLPETLESLMRDEGVAVDADYCKRKVQTCHRFAAWAQTHGAIFLDCVTPDTAWAFITSVEAGAKTRNNLVGMLSASWSLLIRHGIAKENPWKYTRTKGATGRTGRAFTPDEMKRILSASKPWPWMETAIMVALYTGLRRGDVMALRWDCIDFDNGVISVVPSKTARLNRRLCLPLHPVLREHLLSLNREGERVVSNALADTGRVWQRILRLAEVTQNENELMTFHNLRHTFATWIRQAGAEKGEQMLLGGWSTLSISNRYDHATERLKELVERLPSVT